MAAAWILLRSLLSRGASQIYFSNNKREADAIAKDMAFSVNSLRVMTSRDGFTTALMSSTITSQKVTSSMVWSPRKELPDPLCSV